MSDYLLCLLTLFLAVVTQATVTGLAAGMCVRRDLPVRLRAAGLALAIGGLVLALHDGYTLELAVGTGLYDLHRAVLSALGGALFALGLAVFRPARP